ncbi:MAG TPA: hypothetical protein VN229_00690 [Terriglobales bacterium]|nr:hypothetical protein [Terriglobales bacterium]
MAVALAIVLAAAGDAAETGAALAMRGDHGSVNDSQAITAQPQKSYVLRLHLLQILATRNCAVFVTLL